jgi:hypothetical protein
VDSLLPAPTARKGRCQRCHREAARLIEGHGEECARQLGLTTATPRLRIDPQTGPDLFTTEGDDHDDPEDHCDGHDR